MIEDVTTGLGRKLVAIRVVNERNELLEEVVEVGPVRDFKGRLDNMWLFVFGEDSMQILGLRGWLREKHPINYSPFRIMKWHTRLSPLS